MKMKIIVIVIFSFGIALAQTMTLSPAVTDNGGGITTGTGVKLLASIGQSVAGTTNSPANELQAGYITLVTRLTGIYEQDVKPPQVFEIGVFHPNPFNSTTGIDIDLTERSEIEFRVFNMLGEKVYDFSDERSAGKYRLIFSPSADLSSGVYLYNITAQGRRVSGKIVLSK